MSICVSCGKPECDHVDECGRYQPCVESIMDTVAAHEMSPCEVLARAAYQPPTLEEEFGRPARPGYKLVRSLMSKVVIEIEEDTPFCCDPSTETYWSM